MKLGITYDTSEMYSKSETNDLHFDFAFSFAGEDREIVNEIALKLKEKGCNVFYDNDYKHVLVGKDLYSYLRDLYNNKCKFVVCFISKDYSKKIWTKLEMTAIKERLMETFFTDDFLIPIILNDTKLIEDIPSFFGFYKHVTTDETADLLIQKSKSTLNEDYLIEGVDKFICYLCDQIYHNLKNKKIHVLKTNNTVTIICNGKKNVFLFESDKKGFTKNILIRKNILNTNYIKLPNYLINWDKKDGLYFTIYNFNVNNNKISEKVALDDLIKYLCKQFMLSNL